VLALEVSVNGNSHCKERKLKSKKDEERNNKQQKSEEKKERRIEKYFLYITLIHEVGKIS
jgi:hypothetical protein